MHLGKPKRERQQRVYFQYYTPAAQNVELEKEKWDECQSLTTFQDSRNKVLTSVTCNQQCKKTNKTQTKPLRTEKVRMGSRLDSTHSVIFFLLETGGLEMADNLQFVPIHTDHFCLLVFYGQGFFDTPMRIQSPDTTVFCCFY